MSYNYDRHNQVQKYKGQPKTDTDRERTIWAKFINAVLPWLTNKWRLGNAFLEAKVKKEVNEADKIRAETVLLQIQAEKAENEMRKVIDIVSYEDEVNAIDIPDEPVSDTQIEEEIKEFIEKIKLCYLKYGMKISISIEHEEQSTLVNEEKMQGQASESEES